MEDYSILALIPARRDSKGILRKNVKELCGRPLIAWSIAAAVNSRYRMRIVCSTDCPQIAEIAREWGAEAPFLRPAHLATDEAPTLDVVLHALESLDETFTHVLLLQPTSPLRTSEDIDGAIDTSLATGADAVIGVSEAKTHPYLTYGVGIGDLMSPICRPDNVSLRRQDLPPAYELNGAIYMNAVSSLLTQRTFLPANSLAHVMPVSRSIDIDLPEDWTAAEQRLSEKV